MTRLLSARTTQVRALARKVEARARAITAIDILLRTFSAYSEDRASLLAAALAYYTLLSLFPLMLFIFAVTSPFLESESAIRAVSIFINSYIPTGTLLLRASLEEVTRLRGPLTLFATVGFLWSASGVFDLLQLGLNRAFCVQRPRPVWRRRIVSLGMVVTISILYGLSFLLTTTLRLGMHYRFINERDILINIVPLLTSIFLGVLIFGLLFRYIPYDPDIHWRNVWLSAVLSAILLELAKLAFAWYLANIAFLNLVYGSVGAIIGVMLWGYITAVILLMGAELAAVMNGARERKSYGGEWWAAIGQED